ncbi:MAG: hypothetical protein CL608_21985 [Anaerolineaceae bacterium]|nr:hypothetical protein [Anaerolineaceae bacterium]
MSEKRFRRKQIWLMRALLLFVLAAVVGWHTAVTQAADAQWQASYWTNRNLSGSPVLSRGESNLNYDWGDGTPDPILDKDKFSARWTRSVNFPAGATYRFTATTDDGMRVWVDNVLIIDSWWDSHVHSLTADVYLNAGDHAVKVEYYEAGGKAIAKLNWAQIGGTGGPVPITNWKGEYFNNSSLFGSPVLVRDDQRIDFSWGGGSPASNVPADQFSARWTRTVSLEGGRYRITARGDDGIRVWANGQLVIDQWHEAQGQAYTVEVNLPAGAVPFQVEFYENVGGATAFLDFYKISGGGSGNGWRGEYFNNRHLSGSPSVVRDDGQVNFNWGSGSPGSGINSDNFSVRWTRSLSFAAGLYRFTATSDDGIRVWVNGQQLINSWTEHQPQTFTGDITLAAGTYPVQIEYFESVGGAQVQVSWTQITTTTPPPTQPTPPTTPSTGTGTVVSPLLNVRRGPGFQYSVLTTLAQGASVQLAGYRSADSHWVMINYNSTQAWVSGKSPYLSTTIPVSNMAVWQGTVPNTGGPTSGATAVVANAYYVNLRMAPQVGNNVITALPSGTTVQLLGRNAAGTWAKVQLSNLTTGWMSATYLNSSVPIATLPVTN